MVVTNGTSDTTVGIHRAYLYRICSTFSLMMSGCHAFNYNYYYLLLLLITIVDGYDHAAISGALNRVSARTAWKRERIAMFPSENPTDSSVGFPEGRRPVVSRPWWTWWRRKWCLINAIQYCYYYNNYYYHYARRPPAAGSWPPRGFDLRDDDDDIASDTISNDNLISTTALFSLVTRDGRSGRAETPDRTRGNIAVTTKSASRPGVVTRRRSPRRRGFGARPSSDRTCPVIIIIYDNNVCSWIFAVRAVLCYRDRLGGLVNYQGVSLTTGRAVRGYPESYDVYTSYSLLRPGANDDDSGFCHDSVDQTLYSYTVENCFHVKKVLIN